MVDDSPPVLSSASEKRLLDLLRMRGLSIKNLDTTTRMELTKFLFHLHQEKGLSLSDIAKLIGTKTSGYTSWLCRSLGVSVRTFEEARLKAIREKRRKYERKPFDGTEEDKAYLLGLRHGDISAYEPWKDVVRASTSTTHPAMAKLFGDSFGPYGHVYRQSRYKKDTATYEWNLSAILDRSFRFLLIDKKDCWKWVLLRKSTQLAYLAGLFDAEGSVGITRNARTTAITTTFYNTDRTLIDFIHKSLVQLGYKPLAPYLDKPRGFRSTGFHITMKKDYWRVMIADFLRSQALLRELPLRHREKIAKKRLALSLTKGDSWSKVSVRVQGLRHEIRSERVQFTLEAERDYLRKRKKPKS